MVKIPGAAAIEIELSEGKITVTHRTNGTILLYGEPKSSKSWQKIFEALDREIIQEEVPTVA
jgi:hypothetical protein